MKNMIEPTENINESGEDETPPGDREIDQLRALLAEAQAQAAAAKDAQLRAAAEAENSRRRLDREAQATAKYATERLVGELIGVADTLELGLQAARASGAEVSALAEGMEMTYKQLMAILEKNGIKQEDPVGQKLNAGAHQAVSVVESGEVPAGHVVAVMQKGYRLHERVIRPAMVVVAKAPADGP